jgi:SAM-dependent methyltransferase
MKNNINTEQYWNNRFANGDWESKNGRDQTKAFSKEQIPKLNLPRSFNGVLLDFGCGLGDAIPLYHRHFPLAKLIGVDHSDVAIRKCQEKYGSIASFLTCDVQNIPDADIIITSNVFEHLSNYNEIAYNLILKCRKLFIIVPYNQDLNNRMDLEHINSFDEASFAGFYVTRKMVYRTRGYKQKNFLWVFWNIYIKNIGRYIVYRRTTKFSPHKQILFEIMGANA